MDPAPLATLPPPPLAHSFWVLPGLLLAGEHPCAAGEEATPERLRRLLAAGIGCFVDLTEPGELTAYDAALPVGVDYLRRPIPDHGTPHRPEYMAEILDCVGEALRAGRAVYLHCRAGIGRTATVAGCLLAERGLTGEAALAELNRLWQQGGRAAHWPAVPETPEQTDFVRHWVRTAPQQADPLFDPATLAAARGLRERFHGALLGLAVGDAVAAATQYRRAGRFTPVGDMLGGGPFDLPRGGWSDDTAMALCLADSLLACEGFDARDQVARYRRWQQQGYLSATGACLGITAGTARALALSQWRRQTFSGSHDPHAPGAEALSRVAAVALYFFARPQEAEDYAAEAARPTCQAPELLTACRALARALLAALSGRPRPGILAEAREALESASLVPAVPPRPGSAAAALGAALEAFGGTMNYRDAVLAAANLGGHSDVVAAVCGALAGAHYSLNAIPAAWRNSLMKKEMLDGYADQLLAHALLDLGR